MFLPWVIGRLEPPNRCRTMDQLVTPSFSQIGGSRLAKRLVHRQSGLMIRFMDLSVSTTAKIDALAGEMVDWVSRRAVAAIERYFPTLRVPGYFAGHRINGDHSIDIGYVFKHLYQLGVREVGEWSIVNALPLILRQIDGLGTRTFYSYRTAEILLAFGRFEGNPLLEGFSDAEKTNLVDATDSTVIYNPAVQSLNGVSNNYWGVLARCEDNRRKLGLPIDPTLLERCLNHCRGILFANPLGFFDDSSEMSGRYDIYSADVHLFLEPLWEHFDQTRLKANLLAHTKLLETIALENGAMVAWGRSTGALSVCIAMEMAATALRDNVTSQPARVMGLLRHAFKQMDGWFADDLIDAHRDRMTMNYRGPHRMLQMTFDCLGKVAYVAQVLKAWTTKSGTDDGEATGNTSTVVSLASVDQGDLFPPQDDWIALNNANAGVWMFRNGVLEFQLAVVSNSGSNYAVAPRGPGLFENPVDMPICWTPRLAIGTSEYAATGLPTHVEKLPSGLRLVYDGWARLTGGPESPSSVAGSRTVTYRVVGDTLSIDEQLTCSQVPDAIGYMVPETVSRPLRVQFESAAEHTASIVAVRGMQTWRSFWGPLARVHEIDFVPADAVQFRTIITPSVKVAHGPAGHDYNRGIYDALPADAVQEIGFDNATSPHVFMEVDKVFKDAEIVHIGWPEHLFAAHGLSEAEFDERISRFIGQLRDSGKKIVWTMHNRRPHGWARDRGIALYRQWAAVADACLHHSRWGMELMRSEYVFNDTCRHVLIPHGHLGALMRVDESRPQLEQRFNLPTSDLRFGVLGRYQKEKQIEMLIEAFIGANRPDAQLVTTAHRPDIILPSAPNVYQLAREPHMLRADIARHTAICDVLLAAHTGDTYLTSGLIADAVAAGVAMLVPDWPFFKEIMGEAAIYHDNTPAGIAHVIANLSRERVEEAKAATRALYDRYDFATLAPQVLDVFRQLCLQT